MTERQDEKATAAEGCDCCRYGCGPHRCSDRRTLLYGPVSERP